MPNKINSVIHKRRRFSIGLTIVHSMHLHIQQRQPYAHHHDEWHWYPSRKLHALRWEFFDLPPSLPYALLSSPSVFHFTTIDVISSHHTIAFTLRRSEKCRRQKDYVIAAMHFTLAIAFFVCLLRFVLIGRKKWSSDGCFDCAIYAKRSPNRFLATRAKWLTANEYSCFFELVKYVHCSRGNTRHFYDSLACLAMIVHHYIIIASRLHSLVFIISLTNLYHVTEKALVVEVIRYLRHGTIKFYTVSDSLLHCIRNRPRRLLWYRLDSMMLPFLMLPPA